MPCELNCTKRLLFVAMIEKQRRYRDILAALCALYLLEPNRRTMISEHDRQMQRPVVVISNGSRDFTTRYFCIM